MAWSVNVALFAAGVTVSAVPANAGGIERGRLSFGTLFEIGRYVEFGAAAVNPSVSGAYADPAFGPFAGTGTDSLSPSFRTFSFAYKQDIDDRLAFAVFVDTPYGADASYHRGPYDGLSATWRSQRIAGLLKYKVNDRFSIYGGAQYERARASITIPDTLIRGGLGLAALGGSPAAAAVLAGSPPGTLRYRADGAYDGRLGYILGAAYEQPEIALRVGLTYESRIVHKFDSEEGMASPALGPVVTAFNDRITRVEIPQSLTLDAQSGIAKDTLLFGSIRWAEWSRWHVRPQVYGAIFASDITNFRDDVFTYQLGIGRKLTDAVSVYARVGYERAEKHEMSTLAPTDGYRSIGIGGTYTKDRMKVTAGVEYFRLGDTFDMLGTRYRGNHALAAGVTVGYRF